MARKLKTLVIWHSRQLRRQFDAWSDRRRYELFLADGRVDGLAMMYRTHPDVIVLETIVDQPESWQILSIIRLFTNTPVLLVVDRPLEARHQSLLTGNSIAVVQPVTPKKIATAMKVVLAESGLYSVLPSPAHDTNLVSSESPVAESYDHMTWFAGLVSKTRTGDPMQAMDQSLFDRLLDLLDADWVALHRLSREVPLRAFDLQSRRAGAGEWGETEVQFLTYRVLDAARLQTLIVINEPDSRRTPSRGRDSACPEIGPLAVMPLVGRTQVHGALSLVRRRDTGKVFTVPQIQFITAVGETLALALDNARLTEQNRESAIWDEATGIHTHAYGNCALESERRRASRYGSRFAVVQLEWTNGEEYRDARGDEDYVRVLRDIATISRRSVRSSDVVAHARERCISFVLPMTDPAGAQQVVARLSDRLEASFLDYAPEARPIFTAQVLGEEVATC